MREEDERGIKMKREEYLELIISLLERITDVGKLKRIYAFINQIFCK